MLKKYAQGWSFGRNKEGKTGLFPSSYVEEIAKSTPTPTPSTPSSGGLSLAASTPNLPASTSDSKTQPQQRAVCIKDFDAKAT